MQPVGERTAQTIEHVFRQEYGRILATLIRVFGDFDVAEDALQEAFIAAVEHWQSAGDNAAAWLTTTARNKGVSRLRRERTQSKLRDQVKLELEVPTVVAPDEPDLLRLIFTCCHPALNQEAQVALTLRTVRRSGDPRSRTRLPAVRADDRATTGTSQAQDPPGPHPVSRASRPPDARALGLGTGRRLPHL
jgi:DNA-directed RNA polymerase specialized sigma24 family protein